MKNIDDIKNNYNNYYNLSNDNNYKDNLIKYNKYLKDKYIKSVYNDKEIDFIPYTVFLETLEEIIYEDLEINEKIKLEIELSRIIKKTKSKEFNKLLDYIRYDMKDNEFEDIRDLIINIELSNNIVPSFYRNLNKIYNDVYANLILNCDKMKNHDNKGKIK